MTYKTFDSSTAVIQTYICKKGIKLELRAVTRSHGTKPVGYDVVYCKSGNNATVLLTTNWQTTRMMTTLSVARVRFNNLIYAIEHSNILIKQ